MLHILTHVLCMCVLDVSLGQKAMFSASRLAGAFRQREAARVVLLSAVSPREKRKETPGTQNHVDKPENQCPDLLTMRYASLQILFKTLMRANLFETAIERPSHVARFWQDAECTCHTKRRFNIQKWPEHRGVFCAFWLRSVLRATGTCKF